MISDRDKTRLLNYGLTIKHEISLKRDVHCCIYSNYTVRLCEPGTLHLSNQTNAEHFFGFCLQHFRQAGPPQRVDCAWPQSEINIKYLSLGHNVVLPV